MQLEQRSGEGLNLAMGLVSDIARVLGFMKLKRREMRKEFNFELI